MVYVQVTLCVVNAETRLCSIHNGNYREKSQDEKISCEHGLTVAKCSISAENVFVDMHLIANCVRSRAVGPTPRS